MAGFEKIELSTQESVVEPKSRLSMARKRKSTNFKKPKNVRKLAIITVVALLLLTFGLVLPAVRTIQAAKTTYTQAKLFAQAMKQQNVDLASEELVKTKAALAETQKNMRILSYLRFVPVAAFYYNDADRLLKAGDEGMQSAEIVIESLKPYADVLGLKGQESFTTGSAEDRIKTAVLTMGKITPRIDEIADSLLIVQKEIDGVNPAHYPEFIFGKKIKAQLTQLRTLTDQGVAFVDEARPLIKVLPSLLGEAEAKKYLILFQNDKELRPTGGFITGFALLTLDKGAIKIEQSSDIYELDDTISGKPVAPDPILKYLSGVSRLNLRDTNISPDFITSMELFNSLYERASGAEEVDGIIAIDTHVLVSTIKVLDDQITVNGQTFTTEVDDRCDCPQVIYELENNISRPVNYIKTDRKGLLGDMLQALMSKALSSSPKEYWGPLFQTMLTQVNEKHVMFYLYDKDAQAGIVALNAAGRILPFEGDYLHINNTNFSGAKTNIFVEETIENAYEVKKDGTVIKTLTIDFTNPYPPSNCNLEAGGLCLNALHRNWFRVYVPKGSTLLSNKGSEVKIDTYDELEKTVFDGFLTVRPGGGKTTLVLEYQLPFKVSDSPLLPVMIQKQPGTDGFEYTTKVNGKTIEKAPLLTDTELELEI